MRAPRTPSRARLRAERRRLQAEPATPARWIERPTGESYGEKWARSSLAERRSWLKDAAFRVFAGKSDMLDYDAVDEHPDEVLGRAD